MPIYRVKIEGRHKSILVKEDSAAKAKDRVATATALTAEEMSTAIEDGERVWKSGEPFPDDEVPQTEEKTLGTHKAIKSETAHAE